MLSLSPRMRVFAAAQPIDFRKGFDGLVQIVRDRFELDPFGGDYFVFFNRRRDRVKLLVWDKNGFWLFYKRLERGTFERVDGRGPRVEIDRARLAMLLEGIDLKQGKIRQHFAEDIRVRARDDHERERAAG
jgi:transposase